MSHEPDVPPESKVKEAADKIAFDFQSGTSYSFSPRQLWQAGQFTLLNLLLTAALVAMTWQPNAERSVGPLLLLLLWSQSALALYILWLFKKLLKEKSGFHAANLAISLVMLATLVAAVIDPFLLQQEQAAAALTNMFEIIFNGALVVYLGRALLQCPDPLYDDLKIIAYLNIASGICFMSIFFIFLGLVLQIPLAYYTARLFFRASLALHKVQN